MTDLEYPDTLRYTTDHEWVQPLGDGKEGTLRVGITAYAQDALGDVVYVSLPSVGDTVSAGDTCGEVESTKSVSDLYAPLSGEVTAVNPRLDSAPELVNTAPYTDGWMYDLKVAADSGVDGGLDGLMDATAYRESLG